VHKLIWLAAFILLASSDVQAGSYLLFVEAQGVAGYSDRKKEVIYYSMNPVDVMQKPGVGLDYLQRLSGEYGDWGALALQLRLAYNEDYRNTGEDEFQPQVYNAYFKYKAGLADLWIGHNRIAFGLASYLDSHATLLQPLAMAGYGYDRDWGAGLSRDLDWGNISMSLSTGSGMRLDTDGNYFASARISFGVLARDNFTLGLSSAYGRPLETVGYEKMAPDPQRTFLAALDAGYFWSNIENRIEIAASDRAEGDSHAILWRIGANFFDDERVKLEFQPVYTKSGVGWNYEISASAAYKLTSDLTLRGMYGYDHMMEESKVIFQIYWYHRML
jgi:hypothetical protein